MSDSLCFAGSRLGWDAMSEMRPEIPAPVEAIEKSGGAIRFERLAPALGAVAHGLVGHVIENAVSH